MADCRLEEWWVERRVSRSSGGERDYLKGRVYGHGEWADGTVISTTAVVWRDGTRALTASGHRYVLGAPRCVDTPGPTAP